MPYKDERKFKFENRAYWTEYNHQISYYDPDEELYTTLDISEHELYSEARTKLFPYKITIHWKDIDTNLTHELLTWFDDNKLPKVTKVNDKENTTDFFFKTEEEAVLFKITWG